MHKSVLSLVCCLFFFLSCQEEIETMPNGSLNIVLTDEAGGYPDFAGGFVR